MYKRQFIDYIQTILCETAVLAGNIAGSSSLAPINITVAPVQSTSTASPAGWVARTCTVGADGLISAISPGISSGLAFANLNPWVLVEGTLYEVAAWISTTECQLAAMASPCAGGAAAWPATGASQAFATMEFRFGNIANGDTLWINGYKFILNTVSQVLNACGLATWNVTPVTAYGGITGWTSGAPTVGQYIPVSYTHLDVYKRQVYTRSTRRFGPAQVRHRST